jgi:molybdopterin synthase sulfur carrier subunit
VSVTIEIPAPLRPFAEGRRQVTLDPAPPTVGEALAALWAHHPALRDRILDEQGRVRPHVNVFVGTQSIRDGAGLGARVADGSEIAIIAAVSGGATPAAAH